MVYLGQRDGGTKGVLQLLEQGDEAGLHVLPTAIDSPQSQAQVTPANPKGRSCMSLGQSWDTEGLEPQGRVLTWMFLISCWVSIPLVFRAFL